MTKKVVQLDAEGTPTGLIRFTFDDHRDAKAATDKEPEVLANPSYEDFDLSKVPGFDPALDRKSMAYRLMLHGASQKIGDSYAQAKAQTDPLSYAKAMVKDTIAQVYAGEWRVNGAGGPRVNELAIAISRATGEALEGEDGTAAMVALMSDDEKKVWREKPAIKAALARIRAEKALKAAEAAEKAAAEDAAKAAAEATPTAA